MGHPYWPLFDLRVITPVLELRVPTDGDLVELARLVGDGIHDPAVMPFAVPFTDTPSPRRERESLQWWWRQRAEWSPDKWSFCGAVFVEGRPVGVQDMNAEHFRTVRSVETGSWLGSEYQGRGLGKEMRAAIVHLAFEGLGAVEALTGAFADNPASLAVSRSLGYEDNGRSRSLQRSQAGTTLRLRLGREAWELRRRHDIIIEGLDPCLELFGLGDETGDADQ